MLLHQSISRSFGIIMFILLFSFMWIYACPVLEVQAFLPLLIVAGVEIAPEVIVGFGALSAACGITFANNEDLRSAFGNWFLHASAPIRLEVGAMAYGYQKVSNNLFNSVSTWFNNATTTTPYGEAPLNGTYADATTPGYTGNAYTIGGASIYIDIASQLVYYHHYNNQTYASYYVSGMTSGAYLSLDSIGTSSGSGSSYTTTYGFRLKDAANNLIMGSNFYFYINAQTTAPVTGITGTNNMPCEHTPNYLDMTKENTNVLDWTTIWANNGTTGTTGSNTLTYTGTDSKLKEGQKIEISQGTNQQNLTVTDVSELDGNTIITVDKPLTNTYTDGKLTNERDLYVPTVEATEAQTITKDQATQIQPLDGNWWTDTIGNMFKPLLDILGLIWDWITGFFAALATVLANALSGIVSALTGVAGTVNNIWDWLKDGVSGLGSIITGALSGVMAHLVTMIQSLTGIQENTSEPDLTNTMRNYNLPDLFILILKIILACIRLILRAIIFIATIIAIPSCDTLLNENIKAGLAFMKNQNMPIINITFFTLVSGMLTLMASMAIARKVRKIYKG